ncbi:hypothetical protein ABVK25_001404 [Lepraria finkii]|uniref:Uncharacterized protein n=1 Tax=Lepraria finkii TaxID=1340010 RepID=A0ABR4BLK5_9LECA
MYLPAPDRSKTVVTTTVAQALDHILLLAQTPRRRGGRSRAATARGGSTHGGRGRGRSGYTGAAGAAGGGVAIPAYATGGDASFGVWDIRA